MSVDVTSAGRALVFGGSGAVGSRVVRELSSRGLDVAWTFFRADPGRRALPGSGYCVDLRDPRAIRALVADLCQGGRAPRVFVHNAVVNRSSPLESVTDADYEDAFAVNVRAPFIAAQALASHFDALLGSSVVLVGAMDRAQSLPLPTHFAATQGALGAMASALAKELGPRGVRVNMVALGPLSEGLSRELSPDLIEDYRRFSALRRLGAPEEAARVVAWLALDNRYISGKTIAVNGGI